MCSHAAKTRTNRYMCQLYTTKQSKPGFADVTVAVRFHYESPFSNARNHPHSQKRRHLGQSGTLPLFQSGCCCSQLSKQDSRRFPVYHSPSGKWSRQIPFHRSWKECISPVLNCTPKQSSFFFASEIYICKTFTYTSFNIPVTTKTETLGQMGYEVIFKCLNSLMVTEFQQTICETEKKPMTDYQKQTNDDSFQFSLSSQWESL